MTNKLSYLGTKYVDWGRGYSLVLYDDDARLGLSAWADMGIVGSPSNVISLWGLFYTNHMPPVKQRFLQVVDVGCTLPLLPLPDGTAGLRPWAYFLVLHKPES